jgi:hypothetical protein
MKRSLLAESSFFARSRAISVGVAPSPPPRKRRALPRHLVSSASRTRRRWAASRRGQRAQVRLESGFCASPDATEPFRGSPGRRGVHGGRHVSHAAAVRPIASVSSRAGEQDVALDAESSMKTLEFECGGDDRLLTPGISCSSSGGPHEPPRVSRRALTFAAFAARRDRPCIRGDRPRSNQRVAVKTLRGLLRNPSCAKHEFRAVRISSIRTWCRSASCTENGDWFFTVGSSTVSTSFAGSWAPRGGAAD